MKILVCEPQKEPYVKEIKNKLSELQMIVGGYIEVVYPFEDLDVCLICDEEGKLKGKQFNTSIKLYAYGAVDIVGTFFLCRVNRTCGEFIGLSDSDIEQYKPMFL